MFGLASVRSLASLAVAFFALRVLGQGAVGLGLLTTVLRWFERHRGRAIAIALSGYAVGEFVMPTVIVTLQESLGWRGSTTVRNGFTAAGAPVGAWLIERGGGFETTLVAAASLAAVAACCALFLPSPSRAGKRAPAGGSAPREPARTRWL
jgi:ABC-type xylose transport system permease subunit